MKKETRFFVDQVKNPKAEVAKLWRKKEHAIRSGNRALAKKLRRQMRTINPRYVKLLPKQMEKAA